MSSDFTIEIDCGEENKHTTLYFRFSRVEGNAPVLTGVDSELSQFSVHVSRTLKSEEKVTKRVMKEVLEYRKRKRELFYEEAEDESTDVTLDN